jgi:hypothetical protein
MPATQLSYVGKDQKLYRNTGSFGSPVWGLIPNVTDVKKASKRNEATFKTRAADEELFGPGLRSREYSWGMVTDETDTDYVAIRAAHEAGSTIIEFAFANGLIATAGTVYTRVSTIVTGFDEDEPLEDGVGASVTVKPAKGGGASSRTTV